MKLFFCGERWKTKWYRNGSEQFVKKMRWENVDCHVYLDLDVMRWESFRLCQPVHWQKFISIRQRFAYRFGQLAVALCEYHNKTQIYIDNNICNS